MIRVCETETATHFVVCSRECGTTDVCDKGNAIVFSSSRIWFTALYHFTCSTQGNLWLVLMYSYIVTLFMAFLSSHTLYEARAHTHQHHDSFLQYTVASSSHSRTVSVVGERICTRNSVLCVAANALVWVLRVFIHTKNKTFVIAYRPAKASSSHNNLTATEWTAHTILFLRARDHNAHHIALLRFYLFSTTIRRCGRRTHTHTNSHAESPKCICINIFSILTVDHNVWLLFEKRLNLTLTQNTERKEKKKNRTVLVRPNGGAQCAVWWSKTESIVKTNNSIKY